MNEVHDGIHLKWSISPATKDRPHFHVRVEDEDAFTEPVTTTSPWRRTTDARWQVLDGGSCFENNKTNVDEQG